MSQFRKNKKIVLLGVWRLAPCSSQVYSTVQQLPRVVFALYSSLHSRNREEELPILYCHKSFDSTHLFVTSIQTETNHRAEH